MIRIGSKGLLLALVVVATGSPTLWAQQPPTRHWEYTEIDGTGRVGKFWGRDIKGSEWINIMGGGQKATFVFVRRTTRFTELFDRSRSMAVLIYDDGYTEWSDGGKWNRGADGKWIE